MSDLSKRQKNTLINIISEALGQKINRNAFDEYALQLLEDVAGFESMDDLKQQSNLDNLWRIYNERKTYDGN